MSPLECSECFGDQLLHRTYTWHLTLVWLFAWDRNKNLRKGNRCKYVCSKGFQKALKSVIIPVLTYVQTLLQPLIRYNLPILWDSDFHNVYNWRGDKWVESPVFQVSSCGPEHGLGSRHLIFFFPQFSRPHCRRKRDTRSESLEIPINVVLPQVG